MCVCVPRASFPIQFRASPFSYCVCVCRYYRYIYIILYLNSFPLVFLCVSACVCLLLLHKTQCVYTQIHRSRQTRKPVWFDLTCSAFLTLVCLPALDSSLNYTLTRSFDGRHTQTEKFLIYFLPLETAPHPLMTSEFSTEIELNTIEPHRQLAYWSV